MKVLLNRIEYEKKQTLGIMSVSNKDEIIYSCKTLELPYLNNQKRISCIPKGEYEVVKHVSPKFGKCFWIKNVPDRSEILIHKGNYHKDTLGCILVGAAFLDINNDGYRDVTSSKKTVEYLLKILPESFNIYIT